MRVVSLGSGSSGNALLIQAARTAVLVDAGFAPRTLVSRLRQAGVAPSALSAILLTHEHYDHARGAVAFARQHGIPIVADPRTLAAVLAQSEPAIREHGAPERLELPVGRQTKLADLEVTSFPVSHDAVAPCGYVLSTRSWSVCFATDTGMAGGAMIEAMRTANLLIIESNHDVQRLKSGPYPYYLKQRILSPTGHLSNEQACQALANVLDDGPRWVWLAHLSRTNNTPDLARAYAREYLRHLGLSHIIPQAAPPGVGSVWDSAALWNGPAQQALWDATAAPASQPSEEPAAVPVADPAGDV